MGTPGLIGSLWLAVVGGAGGCGRTEAPIVVEDGTLVVSFGAPVVSGCKAVARVVSLVVSGGRKVIEAEAGTATLAIWACKTSFTEVLETCCWLATAGAMVVAWKGVVPEVKGEKPLVSRGKH